MRALQLIDALDVEIVNGWNSRAERILRRYADRASIADAILLALAEEDAERIVVTTDREDFRAYRLRRRRAVPSLMPPE